MSLDVLVVVLAGGEGTRLWPLTAERNKPAVPFGGKYRLVDIPLSNAVNSGLNRILMVTQGKDDSFTRHINHAWHLDPKHGVIRGISPQEQGGEYLGDADSVRQILDKVKRERPEIVLVVPGDNVVKMDYLRFARFLDGYKGASAAISMVEKPIARAGDLGSMVVNFESRITYFREKDPNTPLRASDEDHFYASMGTYAFRTGVLLRVLKENPGSLFGKDIFPPLIKEAIVLGYNFSKENEIRGYRFDPATFSYAPVRRTRDSDYWEDAGRISEYHAVHMDLVGVEPKFDIHSPNEPGSMDSRWYWPLRTFVEGGLGPGKILRGGEVRDVVLSDGVILSSVGAYRCVFSPMVHVENSSLENAIVFEGAVIRNCRIKNAIIDKNVRLEGVEIGYGKSPDEAIFLSSLGISVVPKNFGRDDFKRDLYTRAR